MLWQPRLRADKFNSAPARPGVGDSPIRRSTRRARSCVQDLDLDQLEENPPAFLPDCNRLGSIRRSLDLRMSLAMNADAKCSKIEDGQTSGVYKIPSDKSGQALAVFKPECEEGFVRRGVPAGGGSKREEAVYLLDRKIGSVAKVPVTMCTKISSELLAKQLGEEIVEESACHKGAAQMFVNNAVGSAEDFGMPTDLRLAAKTIPIVDAQHIAALDIRICNTDRHGGNLLFKKGSSGDAHPAVLKSLYEPVPIDHGCVLPYWWAIGEVSFEAWDGWPQVHAPCLPEVVQSVEAAFACKEESMEMLAHLGIAAAARATYRIGLAVLHAGTVRHKLSLATVGRLLAREAPGMGQPSWVELQMEECAKALGVAWEWVENDYGDKVPTAPCDPTAWPADGYLEKLEAVFCSEAMLLAGRDLEVQLMS